MAVFELPLRSDLERFEFVLTLDAVAYKFLFSWNSRESGWFMSLFLEDDTPVWSGVRVVVNWPLQQRSRVSNRPPGLFMAVDAQETKTDPGLTDLGKRVRLLYFDAESVAALRVSLEAA